MSSGPPVLVLSSSSEQDVEAVRTRFPELVVAGCSSYSGLPEALETHRPRVVFAAKIGSEAFPREALFAASSVEWIQCASAGVDHLHPIDPRVRVSSASGVHDDALADYVICHALGANLHVRAFAEQQRERRWQPRELTGATGQRMVVLGFGSIGRRVADKARGIGMKVVGVRRRAGAPGGAGAVGSERLPEVVADADFLVVCLPLTPQTRGLVSAETLACMKSGSVLINISRGGIVDERALVEALSAGPLKAAVMDVFETEPLPRDSELWAIENLTITPHTGDIAGWRDKVRALFEDNLERFLRGEAPQNLVSPADGY